MMRLLQFVICIAVVHTIHRIGISLIQIQLVFDLVPFSFGSEGNGSTAILHENGSNDQGFFLLGLGKFLDLTE
jgi:hypothetical protein